MSGQSEAVSDIIGSDNSAAQPQGDGALPVDGADAAWNSQDSTQALAKALSDELQRVKSKIDEQVTKIGAVEDDVKRAKDAQAADARRVVSSLAVFVGLFTFISISFQITELTSNILSGAGLVLLLLGGMGLFLLLLIALLGKDEQGEYDSNKAKLRLFKDKLFWLAVVPILVIGIGGVMIWRGQDEQNKYKVQELISSEVEVMVQAETSDLRNQLNIEKERASSGELKMKILENCLQNGIVSCSLDVNSAR